ncbi:hypothetical protein [Deinococcus irradiatisoli]|uniref:hypothetical protein n=1 Tax=Deinococcus irradiatisoli TaxID=2202254 RepID=UPI0011B1DFC0|nr:hypothetical protein [Deinococcus irradiatisoli]
MTNQLPKMSYAQYRPGWEPESTLGEGGPAKATVLRTPIGEVNEAEVGRIITRMAESGVREARAAGLLLERIRGGSVTPLKLLKPDGRWERDAPRNAAYAIAVLTMAVQLRDGAAEQYLPYCRRIMHGRWLKTWRVNATVLIELQKSSMSKRRRKVGAFLMVRNLCPSGVYPSIRSTNLNRPCVVGAPSAPSWRPRLGSFLLLPSGGA